MDYDNRRRSPAPTGLQIQAVPEGENKKAGDSKRLVHPQQGN